MESIIVALISGALPLIGVIITNNKNNKDNMKAIEARLEKQQALTDCKLEELTREVRKHNNFAERMPVVEQQIKGINEKINLLHSDK
jgi:hypothetical protein